jgi:hypothetical protein
MVTMDRSFAYFQCRTLFASTRNFAEILVPGVNWITAHPSGPHTLDGTHPVEESSRSIREPIRDERLAIPPKRCGTSWGTGMRKAILTLVLAIASSIAAAEWIEVTRDEISVTYADPGTIGRAGEVMKMWTLLDFKAAQARPYGTPYMSQKTQHEYDCKEKRARIVQVLRYSENMGGGDVVPADSDAEEWKPVATGSVIEKLWGIACKK